MSQPAEIVALEARDYAVATGLLMLGSGWLMVGIAVARGVRWSAALGEYLWGGLYFVGGWVVLMALFFGMYSGFRGLRGKPRGVFPELPANVRVATGTDAVVVLAKSRAFYFSFLILLALAAPRFASAVAGFSLLGLLMFPALIYYRTKPPRYLARRPNSRRFQRTWYRDRVTA